MGARRKRSVGGDLLPRGDRVEASVRLPELERNLPDRPVAMLRDLRLDELYLGVRVLLAVAVEEDHDVGVLLDAARLPKVGESRLGGAALLDAARQLGEGNDRDLELARELLETAADLAHLLDPVGVLVRGRCLHELQVVDDDEIEAALLGLQP